MFSNYQKLTVRQKSIELTKDIYKVTKQFPPSEFYGLVNQMRRSSTSIPCNIAEWNQRNTNKEHINFLYIAKWSAAELETQIIISHELEFLSEKEKNDLLGKVEEILKMLASFITTLTNKNLSSKH